jgi:hypothetical protein
MLSRLLPILPNLVPLPIAVMVAIAKPLATLVPLKIRLSSLLGSFSTESDSPVRIDSLTEKSFERIIIGSTEIIGEKLDI